MMNEIFNEIKQAFGSLWKYRLRGESLEIMTPFSTSTDMYVSVFLTKRKDAWIVTDGGWLGSGVYQRELPIDDILFSRMLDFYVEEHGISRTTNALDLPFYYKGTRHRELIPNIVFDVASFVSSVVTSACIELKAEKEKSTFRNQAKEFLKEGLGSERVRFNQKLHSTIPFNFGAVVKRQHGEKMNIINFVSASQIVTFKSNIAASNVSFDLLSLTPIWRKVSEKIILLDDTEMPFKYSVIESSIELCRSKNQKVLSWKNDREYLLRLASE